MEAILKNTSLLDLLNEVPECRQLLGWYSNNQRFKDFIDTPDHTRKLESIIRQQRKNPSKLRDRLSELRFAHNLLLLDDYSILKYESPILQSKRSIDFLARGPYGDFNVEVTRINPAPFDDIRTAIMIRIKNTLNSSPSNHVVSINSLRLDFPINQSDSRNGKLLYKLYEKYAIQGDSHDHAAAFFTGLIIGQLSRLNPFSSQQDSMSYPMFSFTDDSNYLREISMLLEVDYSPKQDIHYAGTLLLIGSYSITYTGFEYEKYGNKVDDKLGQFINGLPNLFIMHSDSDTHDPGHGQQSEFISSLGRSLNRLSIVYLDQTSVNNIKFLSAAILFSHWSGFDFTQSVWFNKHSQNPIDERVLFDIYSVYKYGRVKRPASSGMIDV